MTTTQENPSPDVSASLDLVLGELTGAAKAIDGATLESAAETVQNAQRVFLFGQGRSGIALRALAMRLMHLGVTVHVVGEATAPAVRSSDTLILASGSGTTATVVSAAQKAADVGAAVIALTSDADSPLAHLADVTVTVKAAVKTDHASVTSRQYAGSLFEQAVFVIGDGLFHALWKRSGARAEELWPRHANIE